MITDDVVQELLTAPRESVGAGLQLAGLGGPPGRTPPGPDLPAKLDDCNQQLSRTYDLSVSAAGQVSIPVIGSVSGGVNRRVVVLERTAFKEIPQDGRRYQYGYAIRLAVTVSKLSAEMKLTLPFLAASAEVGQIEAQWQLQVIGLAGTKINAVSIPPTELNVETFVLAKQSLTALIGAVDDPTTKFSPELIAVIQPFEAELPSAVAKAYALGRLERGRKLKDAMADLKMGRDEWRGTIAQVYEQVAGIMADDQVPSEQAKAAASRLLGGAKVDPR